MVSVIPHRGPDQWGCYLGCSGSVLPIDTRLSIVDRRVFCERFEDSAARFSLVRGDSTLADGRI
jgi:hypothetical protein